MLIHSFLEYLQHEKKYSSHTIKAYEQDLYSFRDFCVVEFKQEEIEEIRRLGTFEQGVGQSVNVAMRKSFAARFLSSSRRGL